MGVAPAVGEYRTDGASLIYVDAILTDNLDLAGKGKRETICVVTVDTGKESEVKEMTLSEVAKLKPVKRG